MALQVWLPLNGNLDNKGLANVSVTNSGATVDASGKIGSCYSFTQSNYLVLNNIPFSKLTNCTVCFWIYLGSNESWLPCTGGNAGSNTGQYFLATSGGTGAFYHSQIGSNTVTIYRDGVVGTSPLASGSWHHYCITGLDLSAWSGITINHYGTYADWNFTGRMNDFRIYDHCLSPKEVKEISKGLVLHYKLDDPYIEATTNIASSLTPQANISGWGRMTATNIGTNAYHLKHTYGSSSNPSYWSTFVYTLPSNYANKTISFSVKLKNIQTTDLNLSTSWIFVGQGNDGQYPTHGSVTKYYSQLTEYMTISWTGTLSNSHRYLVVELWNNDTSTSGKIEFDLFDIQIEEKDHATPYTPSSRAQGMVYDCSGYERNGTPNGTLTVDNDTPRYNECVKFDGVDSNVLCPLNYPILGNDFTISAWIKSNNGSGYRCAIGNELGDGGIVFCQHMSTSQICCYLNSNTGADINVCNYSSFQLNKWYHVVYVVQNALSSPIAKLYINGELITTASGNTALGEPNQPIYVGSLRNNSYYWNGQISDFRLYTTTLSADDIKDLYQTAASIHNTGTIDAFEFEENTSSIVNKTGIVESGTIIENNDYLYTLSDGSVWFKILHHNNPASNLFTASNCWDYNDGSNLYSKLGWLKTGIWTNSSGEYEFLIREKLTSSSSENQFRWKQTSNPSTSSTITGYSAISGSPSYAGGLKTNGSYGAMHNGNTWWCCCGSYTAYQGGIPGFFGIVTTGYLDLYVRIVEPNAPGIDNTARVYSNTISSNQIIEI